jgi:hypothetical protein
MARLPPITSKEQVAAKDHATVDAITHSRGAIQGPFTMFLHSPELAGRVAHLGAFVRFEGSLDMRVRVLAAMTVAREFEAVYVWGAQTGGARRLGVPESTIAAIRENHPVTCRRKTSRSWTSPVNYSANIGLTTRRPRLCGRGSAMTVSSN